MNTGTADMTTTEQRLADALRAILPFAERDVGELLDLVRDDESEAEANEASEALWAARNTLAAYDAQQVAAPSGWAHEGDTIYRDDGIAIAHCFSEQSIAAAIVGEHTAARIVQCVNAHDTLVSALRDIISYCVESVPESPCHADLDTLGGKARDALAQAGVHHA